MSVTTRAHSDSALLLCLAETNGSGGCPRNHVCELGQNRKRTHTPWQALSHLGDALHIPIRPSSLAVPCSGPLPSIATMPSAITKCAGIVLLISRMLRSIPFQCSTFFGQPWTEPGMV